MSDTKTPEPPHSPPARRRLLQWCAFGFGAVASAAMGIPIVGYLLGILLKPKPDEWINLGSLDQFPAGQTRLKNFDIPNQPGRQVPWNGETKRTSAYVRHISDNQFQVFAINCAHLGCPVAWFAQSGLFMCPCHGGVYYEDGSYASGPPPRGLYEYEYRIRDGQLEIFGGHLPTLQAPLRKPVSGEKA